MIPWITHPRNSTQFQVHEQNNFGLASFCWPSLARWGKHAVKQLRQHFYPLWKQYRDLYKMQMNFFSNMKTKQNDTLPLLPPVTRYMKHETRKPRQVQTRLCFSCTARGWKWAKRMNMSVTWTRGNCQILNCIFREFTLRNQVSRFRYNEYYWYPG